MVSFTLVAVAAAMVAVAGALGWFARAMAGRLRYRAMCSARLREALWEQN